MKIWQAVTLGVFGFVLLITLLVFVVIRMTAPARALSRDFFDAMRAGDWQQVEAMAHPDLLADPGFAQLRDTLQSLPPFERYFFNSSSWENGVFEGRGTGWTASGCQSPLVIGRKNGLVYKFSMNELCDGGSSA